MTNLIELWDKHSSEWRDPAQVTSHWQEAALFDPKLLHYTIKGNFWEIVANLKITLFVTREYEHLVMAIGNTGTTSRLSFQPMPHPSGLVVDRNKSVIYIASTRNPNQVYDFEPVVNQVQNSLVPVRSRFFSGSMYFHDIALIKDELYANAVAQNAIVRLDPKNGYQRVWWPTCIEAKGPKAFSLNYLQLNSIASGEDLHSSFFSASTDRVLLRRRPGQKSFAVDKKGVIFSAATREPCARNLTRPHSARLHQGKLWVDNSGYGEFGYCEDGQFHVVTKLPGWTRGLCFVDNIAFVGTSRVIPRFRHYAPGLIAEKSRCGIHAVDIQSGQVLGSLLWPYGNQLFAIDWIKSEICDGFPFKVGKRATEREKKLFYSFETQSIQNRNDYEKT